MWDDFEAQARNSSHANVSQCSVGKLLRLLASPSAVAELHGDVTPGVKAALANPELTHRGIMRALRSKLDVSWDVPGDQSIARHRKGDCSCPKEGN